MLDALAAAAKALLYSGFLSGVGVIFACFALRSDAIDVVYANRIVRRGLLLGICACVAGAYVLLLRLGGEFDETVLSAVFASSTGASLLMQLTGTVLVLALPDDRDSGFIRLGSGALILLSFGFSGHAATAGPFEGLFAFIHASAAAWWIGSLWLLRRACLRSEPANAVQLVRRFSALATRFIAVLAVAGALLIYALVDLSTLPALSAYQRNLAIKLALVVAVLALASYNKFRLTPRLLDGDASATNALRRSIDIELLIIGAILIATAITTTYTSPHE